MLFTINNQQKIKNYQQPHLSNKADKIREDKIIYLISPGDIYTDPVSGEPQFSCL